MSRELLAEKKSQTTTVAPKGLLQRKRANGHELETVPPIVHEVLRSSGEPLDAETRGFFELRFGHDFSQVRVHADAKAAESAKAVNALAYSVGQNVVFGAGYYSPGSVAGKRLLAHELIHVTQQAGFSHGSGDGIGIVSDSHSERLADAAAVCALSGRGISGVSRTSGPCLQRQADPAVPNEYSITLVMPPGIRQVERNLDPVNAIRILRSFLNRLKGRIEAGREGHNYIKSIREDQYIVGWVSDVAGGVSLPPLTIWDDPVRKGETAERLIAAGEFTNAARVLQSAANAVHACDGLLYEYREGTIAGAERTKFALEVVEVAAAAAVTVGTGGTPGVVLGAGYVGAQRLAGETTSTYLGLQQRIDWGGILFDTLFAAVCGRFGGRLGSAIARRLGGKIAAKVASSLVVGRASALAHAVARELFDTLVRAKADLTVEGFIERLADQLTLRALFLDLVSTVVGAGVQRGAGARRSLPPASPPGKPKSPPAPVTDIAAARNRLRQLSQQPSIPQPARARATFDGAAARALAPQEALLPGGRQMPAPVPANATDAVVLPFRSPASASGPSAAGSTSVFSASAIAAAAGPGSSGQNQPLQVRLVLPPRRRCMRICMATWSGNDGLSMCLVVRGKPRKVESGTRTCSLGDRWE